MIPRIVFQFWNDVSTIPEYYPIFLQHHTNLLPEFQFLLWNDVDARQFLQDHYPWFLSVYDGYDKPIKRYDAIRYFFLYHYGGIYMDIDSVIMKRFDPILESLNSEDDNALFGYQRRDTTAWDAVGNSFMMTSPRHPVFLRIIGELTRFRSLPVLLATGPLFLTRLLHKSMDTNVHILEMPFLYPFEWYQDDEKQKLVHYRNDPDFIRQWTTVFPYSIIMTLWSGSWKKK